MPLIEQEQAKEFRIFERSGKMRVISNLFEEQETLFRNTKEEIKNVYLSDDRPWVIGYSGGKDSTAVVQLVFEALSELDRNLLTKKVYVIASDTLVETPLIVQSINTTLRRIEKKAIELGLPFETHKVKPLIEQSFWVNIIGRGYPLPNQQFRWCTDRMKIDPSNRFIMDKVNSFGEVIMLLGVREKESKTRANVIKSHSTDGKVLMKHSTLPNAYVYAPIKNFDVDDVWNYLLNNESPWGDDNYELYRLYSDSNSGECPLIVDKTIKETAGSCGNSRFGCWVCTVVEEDKALSGFIQSGHDWMKPLLAFRNWLANIRDDRTMRMKYRNNGQIYLLKVNQLEDKGKRWIFLPKKGNREPQRIQLDNFTIIKRNELNDYIKRHNIDLSTSEDPKILIEDEDGNLYRLGLGPFTLEARKEILERLLKLQKSIKHPYEDNYELIQVEELKEIRRIWFYSGDFEDSLPKIYRKVYGHDLDWETDEHLLFDEEDLTQLEMTCKEYDLDFRLMKKLLIIEKQYSGYKLRRGIMDKLSSALIQDYLYL